MGVPPGAYLLIDGLPRIGSIGWRSAPVDSEAISLVIAGRDPDAGRGSRLREIYRWSGGNPLCALQLLSVAPEDFARMVYPGHRGSGRAPTRDR